jgi:hypothetical protein
MRKLLCVLSLAGAAALTASTAQAAYYYPVTVYPQYPVRTPAETTTGVVAGTAVGVGVSEGWFGSTVAGAALPAGAAGAAAVGGVAGIGAIALIDAATQPCRGFAALFGLNHGACVDGHYVGYGPRTRYRQPG